jgi:2-dehydropantoate 2-reductase
VPHSADAVLLAVRGDQIDDALEARLGSASRAPLIALTPILPRAQERLRNQLGERLVVAMPTVAAQLAANGVVRYWAFDSNPTLIETSAAWRVVLARLSGRFAASHLAVRLEPDVSRKNPATTIALFPLSVAIGNAGSLRALAARGDLLGTAGAACRESLAVAQKVGPVQPAAALGARISSRLTLRAALALGQRMAPSAMSFLDSHFGAKLGAQQAAFGVEILELGRDFGIEMPNLRKLLQTGLSPAGR